MSVQASEHEGRGLALAALLIGALAIAFAPIFAKLVEDVGTTASAFWRTGLAVPLLITFSGLSRVIQKAKIRNQPVQRVRVPMTRGRLLWLIIPGVVFAGDLASWHLALEYTTAAASTLLANLQAVIVGFIGWLVLKERMSRLFAIGAAMALGGTVLVLFAPGKEIESAARPMLGNSISIVTAFFYASYILSIKKARENSTAMEIMIGASIACSIVLLIIALAAGEQIMPTTTRDWWMVLGLAIVPHCVGQGLIAHALAHLPASFSAVTLLLQPVAAAIWGWLFLKEPLTAAQMGAGAIVVVGIYLARRGSLAQ